MTEHSDRDIPSAYFDASGTVVEMISHSSAWQRWWQESALPELDIDVKYARGEERDSTIIHGTTVRANFQLNSSRFQGLSRGNLEYLASSDLETIFTRVASELKMPSPPNVPRTSDAYEPSPKASNRQARHAALRKRHKGRTQR